MPYFHSTEFIFHSVAKSLSIVTSCYSILQSGLIWLIWIILYYQQIFLPLYISIPVSRILVNVCFNTSQPRHLMNSTSEHCNTWQLFLHACLFVCLFACLFMIASNSCASSFAPCSFGISDSLWLIYHQKHSKSPTTKQPQNLINLYNHWHL